MLELGGVGWLVGGLEVEQRGGELSLPQIETLTQERLSAETGDGVSRSHEGGGNVSTIRSKDQIAARWAEM